MAKTGFLGKFFYSQINRTVMKTIGKVIKHLSTLTFKTNIHYHIFNIKNYFNLIKFI